MVFSLTQTAIFWIEWFMSTVGIPGLMALMFFESLGLPPLPSEVILPFAGVLLSQGAVGFLGIPFTWVTVLGAALLGGLLGALGGYLLGHELEMPVLRLIGKRFFIEEKDIQRAERFFEQRGEITVLLSRLLPILRAYISYPAGAARMDLKRFAAFTVIGSFPFTVALVYAGYVLGEHFSDLDPYFNALDVVGAIILAGLLVYVYLKMRRRAREAKEAGPKAQAPPQ